MGDNFIYIKEMINSNINQSSDGGSLKLDPISTEKLNNFLTSIDGSIELLQIEHAYIHNLSNAEKLAKKYFNDLITELTKFRIEKFEESNHQNPWGNKVNEEILKITPLRDKLFQLFVIIYENAANTLFAHDLFKQLLQVSYNEFEYFGTMDSQGYWITDHIRNFVYEIFLYTITYLAKNEKIEEMERLITIPYQMKCVEEKNSSSPITRYQSVSFVRFNMPVPSINDPIRRNKMNVINDNKNLYADLIISKYVNNDYITLQDIISTDVLLYFISLSWISIKHEKLIWQPYTSHYRKERTSELMLKAVSISFFDRIKGLFKFKSHEDLAVAIPLIGRKHYELQSILQYYNLPQIDEALNYHNLNTQA